ncbi:restriction endonuclease subunit S [Streptomyces sp. NPDC058291]|uniref:restriction endonuclease subunit S n=1 Tax=Streptomyces sp. NPDC058291 TaxID=3346427 RepID=UPI0036EFA47E
MTAGALSEVTAPDHWHWQDLWAVAPRVKEIGRPDLEPLSVYLEAGVVPRSSRGDNHNQLGEDLSRYLVVQPDDIVFNKLRTWQGGLGVSQHSGIVSPAYFVCRPSSMARPRFLHYLLRSSPYLAELTRISKWMPPSQFDTPWEQLRKIPILLPSLEEQRRIAEFLDTETAKLTRIDDRFNRLADLLDERKSALTFDCFTFDGISQAPRIPLRRVVKRWIDYRGATPVKTDAGIPLVTAKNIREGRIDLEVSREYIATDDYTDWMRRGLLELSDVLLTTEAPLGQVAMVNDTSIALAQRIIVLRTARNLCSPEWLYWYLRSPQGQAELKLRATGSTALGIKADRLRGVPIPLPPLSVASRRISRLATHVAQIYGLQQRLVRQRALVAERRQALITAAVTGQFDVSTASGRNVTEGVSV